MQYSNKIDSPVVARGAGQYRSVDSRGAYGLSLVENNFVQNTLKTDNARPDFESFRTKSSRTDSFGERQSVSDSQVVRQPEEFEQQRSGQSKSKDPYAPSKRKRPTIRVRRGHWSLLNYYIGIFLTLGLLSLCLFFAAQQSGEGEVLGSSLYVFLGLPISLLILTYLIVGIVIKLNNSRFEIRTNCVRYLRGRVSIRQEVIEIPFQDIGWVRVSQNIVERFFDIGTIEVGTRHSHSPEIVAKGRIEPHKYAGVIFRRLAKSRRTRG